MPLCENLMIVSNENEIVRAMNNEVDQILKQLKTNEKTFSDW